MFSTTWTCSLLQLCPRYLRSLRVTEGQRAPRACGTNTLQHRPRSRSGLGTVVLSPRQESCFWHRRKRGKKPADLQSWDQYKLHLLLMKLLLIQSDLVSHSLTIALPRALDRASARGVFSPSTCSSPPLVGIADHAGIGSLQGEA